MQKIHDDIVYIPVTSYIREDNLRELVQRHYDKTRSIRKTIKRLALVDNIYISRNRVVKYIHMSNSYPRLEITQDDIDYINAQPVPCTTFRQLRKHIGLRQQDIAEYLNVTQSNVSQMERTGDYRISDLVRLTHTLGGTIEIKINLPGMKSVVLDHSHTLE